MAIQSIAGGLFLPSPPSLSSSAGSYATTLTLDAATEKAAIAIFRAPKTGTLDLISFGLRAVTQAPTNGLKVSFQNLDASGDPDGTGDEYRVVTAGLTANTWVTPGLMTSDGTDGGTKRSVTAGDWIAAVVEFASFSAGDNLVISSVVGVATGSPMLTRYTSLFTASWARNAVNMPVVALKYTDGYTYFGDAIVPALALDASSFNTGSTPDERGLLFEVPFPATLSGFWVRAASGGAGRDFDVVLYDAGGAQRTATGDSSNLVSTNGYNYQGIWSTPLSLTANTPYRLIVKPTTASSVTLYEYTLNHADIAASLPGGSTWKHTSRTDAGSWTDDATRRPWMGLVLSGFDDGAGAGGLLTHPGMAGGMRG